MYVHTCSFLRRSNSDLQSPPPPKNGLYIQCTFLLRIAFERFLDRLCFARRIFFLLHKICDFFSSHLSTDHEQFHDYSYCVNFD